LVFPPINHNMQNETFIFEYIEPQPSRPHINDEWNFVNSCVSVSQKMIQSALTSYKTS
jgi:hypothetical protein